MSQRKVTARKASAPRATRSSSAPEALLCVDIGNTHTGLGVFLDGELQDLFRINSAVPRTGDELRPLVAALVHPWREPLLASRRAIVSSVVPSLTSSWVDLVKRYLGAAPILLNARLDLGLEIGVKDPDSVGADRIANSVGVAASYRLPAIVVDLGTATNFDVVLPGPRYVGGAIAPGVATSAEDLFRRGARLAKVEIERPPRALGRTTQECLQSGVYYGAVGQIDGLVRRIAQELRIKPSVVATGGLAESIARDSETITAVDPALTLRGLYLIERRARGRTAPTPLARRRTGN